MISKLLNSQDKDHLGKYFQQNLNQIKNYMQLKLFKKNFLKKYYIQEQK